MIHKTNTHQTSNPLFPCFFVVIACLFSLSLAKTTNTQTPHNVVVGSKCEDTVCFEVQECGPQACVDAKRESRQKGMVEGVHTNEAMAVSLLNDCVVVGDTVGMVVVAVCCGMDVECKRMWGCTQKTDCTKVV